MLNGLYNNFLKCEKPNIPFTKYWAKFCLVFTKFAMHCHRVGVALVLHCHCVDSLRRCAPPIKQLGRFAPSSPASRFTPLLKPNLAKAVLLILVLFSYIMEITTFVNTTKHFCSKTTISVMW